MDATSLDHALARVFPVMSDRAHLEHLGSHEHPSVEGAFFVTLRLILWDVLEHGRTIREIREQMVYLSAEHAIHPNFRHFLTGWRRALLHVFEHATPDRLGWCMPHDLAAFDALDLKRPQDAEDYAAALLNAKKRFGKLC